MKIGYPSLQGVHCLVARVGNRALGSRHHAFAQSGDRSISTFRAHLTNIVGYYEHALSIEDRVVERERAKGRPVGQDERLLESMRESLKAALEALRRVEKS